MLWNYNLVSFYAWTLLWYVIRKNHCSRTDHLNLTAYVAFAHSFTKLLHMQASVIVFVKVKTTRQEENGPTSRSQTAAIRSVGIDLYKRIITFTAKWDHRNRTEVKEVFLAEGQDLDVPRGFVSFKCWCFIFDRLCLPAFLFIYSFIWCSGAVASLKRCFMMMKCHFQSVRLLTHKFISTSFRNELL